MHDLRAISSAATAPADTASDAPPAVRLHNVSKSYRLYDRPSDRLIDQLGINRLMFWKQQAVNYHLFHALKNVDFSIGKGERIGIIGRNGAGKTTLLKLITGNFMPSEGVVEINGTVQALMQLGIGFHQEFSGYENIKAALHYNGLIGAEFDAALEDVVDFVELGEFLHQPMKTYSLGMNARVQFATATAIKPDILIIDEVLGAGDAYFSAKSSRRVRALTDHDCTLLLVSHSTPQLLQFCTRAVWLEEGAVVMDGPAKEVVGAYEVFSEQRIRAAQEQGEQARRADGGESAPSNARLTEKRWIADRILAKEVTLGDVPGTAGAATSRSSSEFKVRLESGLDVFRWPGRPGLKYVDVQLINAEGAATYTLATHQNATIRCTLLKEIDGPLRSRVLITAFNLEALRLMWITSPLMQFEGVAGSRHVVEARLVPVLLGGGTYILSVSLFDVDDLENLSAEGRFDLLARCLEFKVLEFDARESPVFHHPASWLLES